MTGITTPPTETSTVQSPVAPFLVDFITSAIMLVFFMVLKKNGGASQAFNFQHAAGLRKTFGLFFQTFGLYRG
jgi:hypothetical protein